MQKAATEVRTTVEATVIRADGSREELGVISDSKRKLTLRERALRKFQRSELSDVRIRSLAAKAHDPSKPFDPEFD